DYHLGADGVPGQRCRVFLLEDLDGLAVDRDAVASGGDLVGQVAQHGIVLEQMSQSLGFGQIVDRDELQVGILERSAQYVTADSSKTINTYFDCHVSSVNL